MTDDQIARLGDIEALTRDELEAIARDPDQPDDVRDHADALLAAGAAENPPAIDATGEAGARLELVRAIAAGMAEVGAVAKDGTNTKDHYSYATVEAMLRAAGCICPNPLEGPKGQDDGCPVRGHGIPF
jgi:hypothetical protein